MAFLACVVQFAIIVVVFPTTIARAQVIRGTVRTQLGEARVPNARVTATDSANATMAEAVSDSAGRFSLHIASARRFRVNVAKIGLQPSSSDWVNAALTDTLEFDVLVPADPIALSSVEITAEANKSFNTRSLEDAQRHGWKIYGPDIINQHRNTASTFMQLLREVDATGVIIDDHPQIGAVKGKGNGPNGACVRSTRLNRCLAVVLDGMPMGYAPYVNPRDIYFLAILTASESASRWGDKAPWGAIVIYTRMNGDKKSP